MEATRVSEMMATGEIQTIGEDATVEEAAKKMRFLGRGCLVVMRGSALAGMITERDMVRKVIALRLSPNEVMVSSIMSHPVVTIGPDASFTDAAKLMVKHSIRRLVVTEGGRVVGILTTTDFAKFLVRKTNLEYLSAALARSAAPLK